MKIKFEEDSLQYKLWCEIVNDVYLEFDTTNDASKADDLINKIEKLLNLFISLPVEAQVKPANDGNIFEMNIYTGRVNGSDIHQKEEQHILFTAKSKKQIEYLIDELCRVIRQTDNTNTHNEIIAGIIGEANRQQIIDDPHYETKKYQEYMQKIETLNKAEMELYFIRKRKKL